MSLLGFLAFIPVFLWVIIAIAAAWDGYRLIQRVHAGDTLSKWEFSITRK
jgi:hypothetical protein